MPEESQLRIFQSMNVLDALREQLQFAFPIRYFSSLLKLFDRKVGVGENANLAGDAHGLHRQILGAQF